MISHDELNGALCLFAGDLQTKGESLGSECKRMQTRVVRGIGRIARVSLVNSCPTRAALGGE